MPLYIRLSVMMLFQYMLFAVWWVPLAAYLSTMGLSRSLTALILSSMAIGCMASPIVGMIADRYFKGQYVLAISNFVVAIMLFLAATTGNPILLFVFLLLAMIFYMPSWGLTSAITMTHIPSDIFPRIRVFGSIGWVVSGVFSLIAVRYFNLDFDGTNLPFYTAAGIGLVAALSNLTLPDTPPPAKGKKASLVDIMGFRSVSLMRDRNFSIFIILSFLSMIPFSMYFSYFSEYLHDMGFQYITMTMNTGQLVEMLIMLSVPFFIKKIGLRNTMILGVIALVVRYAAFWLSGDQAQLGYILMGVLVHGVIFGYFYIGGQIYIDRKAPSTLQSQGQGFIFFVTFGLGMLSGNFINGWIINLFSSETAGGILYQWNSIWGITTIMSVVMLLLFVLLFKKEDYKTIELEE